mmetsp:Transcript_3153/g.10531  ORF Transcript_3153/g.10531 Transcript_3153/m.10531 type:complete len:247 (-) Transcript_3153:9-749(-)
MSTCEVEQTRVTAFVAVNDTSESPAAEMCATPTVRPDTLALYEAEMSVSFAVMLPKVTTDLVPELTVSSPASPVPTATSPRVSAKTPSGCALARRPTTTSPPKETWRSPAASSAMTSPEFEAPAYASGCGTEISALTQLLVWPETNPRTSVPRLSTEDITWGRSSWLACKRKEALPLGRTVDHTAMPSFACTPAKGPTSRTSVIGSQGCPPEAIDPRVATMMLKRRLAMARKCKRRLRSLIRGCPH